MVKTPEEEARDAAAQLGLEGGNLADILGAKGAEAEKAFQDKKVAEVLAAAKKRASDEVAAQLAREEAERDAARKAEQEAQVCWQFVPRRSGRTNVPCLPEEKKIIFKK